MKHCWKMAPEERPTFAELGFTISKLTEHIAGYLQMGYNPFTWGMGKEEEDKVEEEEEEEEEEEKGEEADLDQGSLSSD